MHRSTTFVTGDPRKPIRVGDQKPCGITAGNVPAFFSFQIRNVDQFPPPRRFNAESRDLWQNHTDCLIEGSWKPRRTQLVLETWALTLFPKLI